MWWDSLQHPGGQCAELYPEKPIYDIPALPVCGAQELVDRLMQQIEPFHPTFHLGQEVIEFARKDSGRFHVRTATGTTFDTGAVVIAAGVGSFQPRRIGIEGSEAHEGTSLHYRVKNSSHFHDRDLVVFGGGDSALDWTLELLPKARSVTLVHRRSDYRAAPASVAKMQEHAAAGRMRVLEALPHSFIVENGTLRGVNVKAKDGASHALDADHLLVFFGLHPKLGAIAEWGLDLEKKALKVDTEKFQTNLPGVFAVGDINTYPVRKSSSCRVSTRRRSRRSRSSTTSFRRRNSSCNTRPRARSCTNAWAFRTEAGARRNILATSGFPRAPRLPASCFNPVVTLYWEDDDEFDAKYPGRGGPGGSADTAAVEPRGGRR